MQVNKNTDDKNTDDKNTDDKNTDYAMVRRAAQRYGTVGAMMAGGMLVFDKLLGRKPKEDAAVVIEASSEPGNIDNDGITLMLDADLTVVSPPPHLRHRDTHTGPRLVRKRRKPNPYKGL
ncbi:MAG: hypothetical protein D4R44_04210 [Actinobacteria bacterium]|nr:MAG: hypothetical protein D4R44_04210 [Actinomycetota bacterium]